MLGAIVPQGEQLWFLKMTGAVDAVGAQAGAFRELVQSVRFLGDGQPAWTLPQGWSQQPASGMRYATLTVGDARPPLEVSVTVLPAGGGDLNEAILANVNRWRNQLSLPPLKGDQLASETETVALTGGGSATLVTMQGQAQSNGMAGPFAGGGMRPFVPRPTTPTVDTTTAAPFEAAHPRHWKPGKVGGMRKAAFEIAADNGQAELTVIDLARDAGDRLANVNRWRDQMQQRPLDRAGLSSALQRINVGEQEGDLVEIAGANEKAGQAILGVIVDVDDKTWFIKLQGTKELVANEKPAFETFVKSIRFR